MKFLPKIRADSPRQIVEASPVSKNECLEFKIPHQRIAKSNGRVLQDSGTVKFLNNLNDGVLDRFQSTVVVQHARKGILHIAKESIDEPVIPLLQLWVSAPGSNECRLRVANKVMKIQKRLPIDFG